jgi:hypothetical protein
VKARFGLFGVVALTGLAISAHAQAPGGPPGYPAPGYGSPPYGEERAHRERCEHLGHEERELRERLAYTPYGEERERMQYRLGELHHEVERCWRR